MKNPQTFSKIKNRHKKVFDLKAMRMLSELVMEENVILKKIIRIYSKYTRKNTPPSNIMCPFVGNFVSNFEDTFDKKKTKCILREIL